jgi:hypothetical protein
MRRQGEGECAGGGTRVSHPSFARFNCCVSLELVQSCLIHSASAYCGVMEVTATDTGGGDAQAAGTNSPSTRSHAAANGSKRRRDADNAAEPSSPVSWLPASSEPAAVGAPVLAPSRLLHPQLHTAELCGLSVAVTSASSLPFLSSARYGRLVASSAIATAPSMYHLSLIESLFLQSELRCLSISQQDCAVSPSALLRHGRQSVPPSPDRFCCLYAAFAHFTRLGWVVREGSKLGVDFLLYQHSQEKRHSDFAVVVRDQSTEGQRLHRRRHRSAWNVSSQCSKACSCTSLCS